MDKVPIVALLLTLNDSRGVGIHENHAVAPVDGGAVAIGCEHDPALRSSGGSNRPQQALIDIPNRPGHGCAVSGIKRRYAGIESAVIDKVSLLVIGGIKPSTPGPHGEVSVIDNQAGVRR